MMNAVLRISVRDVVHHAVEELSARDARVAQELVNRAWERMPAIADFVTPDLVDKFIDLACSVHHLPPIDGEVASIKECERWFREIVEEAHFATMPNEEYRACAYRLMRNVFCFSEHDLADLDLGFYKAMMAFVRPMRDAITRHNLTH